MSKSPSVVTLEDGKLQGCFKVDWLGGRYYSFQGIPYAKPPIGNLRFKDPLPVDPWTGIKDASKEGPDCYQRHMMTQKFVGSEDCLYLNVYTSQLPEGGDQPLRPVMVWIHGGAFMNGSGSTEVYGPEFLVTEDVVVVTINYRVGFLGFSYFADPALGVPGNAGLKDQVLALRWVQKNINKFGGDSNNVTIFGESAGGAAVHYLMLSPLAKGLFHRAIAQSGVATAGWSIGQLTAPLVATFLNCENQKEADVLKAFTELTVEQVLEVQEKVPEGESIGGGRPYGLVVESNNDKTAFLTSKPHEIIAAGTYNHVPLMIGYTSREGMLLEFYNKIKFGEIKWIDNFESVLPAGLNLKFGSALSKEIAEKVKQFYYGNEEASMENIDQYYLVGTDAWFLLEITNAIRQHIKTAKCPIYYYRMSIDSRLNLFKKLSAITKPGVAHGDDIGYLFKNLLTPPEIRPDSIEDIGIRRFLKLWTTFAKYGNPNPDKDNKLINVKWLPIEENKLHYLEIGENLTVGLNPENERMEFWDSIYALCPSKI